MFSQVQPSLAKFSQVYTCFGKFIKFTQVKPSLELRESSWHDLSKNVSNIHKHIRTLRFKIIKDIFKVPNKTVLYVSPLLN